MLHNLKNDTSNVRCVYDDRFDDLTIKIRQSEMFYSDEIISDVYMVRDEENDDLVAIQILQFLSRSIDRLRDLFPVQYYELICHCKAEIQNRNL